MRAIIIVAVVVAIVVLAVAFPLIVGWWEEKYKKEVEENDW